MLYRHLPKIANRVFSILSLDLWDSRAPGDGLREKELLGLSVEHGITLVWAGFGAEGALRSLKLVESGGMRERLSLIIGFDGGNAADLGRFMDSSGAGPNDILLLNLPDAECASTLRGGDLVDALGGLRRQGRICGFGFSAPAEAPVIEAALDASDDWDCWSMPYNYLKDELDGIILRAGLSGLGLLARDPFAGGRLEGVPAGVHELFRDAPVPRSHEEWALRAVWDRQEVASLILDPSSPVQLTTAAILAEAGRPNSLLSRERDVLREASARLNT